MVIENLSDAVITPWVVKFSPNTKVEYRDISEKVGISSISKEIIDRLAKLCNGKIHHLIQKELFFAHENLESIVERCEKNEPFFVHFIRRPSSKSLHFGHFATLLFVKWLQETFNCVVLIQIASEDVNYKNLMENSSKPEKMEKIEEKAIENARDIIAIGFNVDRTFIYTETDIPQNLPSLFRNMVLVSKFLPYDSIASSSRFDGSEPIGLVNYAALRVASYMSSSFPFIFDGRNDIPCLIVSGIDQEPFHRIARGVMEKFNSPKPSTIYMKFFPALGCKPDLFVKMSTSLSVDPDPSLKPISLSDTKDEIEKKIKKYAFSGGRATKEEHQKFGGDCNVDIAFQYLKYFMEDLDELEEIRKEYSSGNLFTGGLKEKTIKKLLQVFLEHHERRKDISNENLKEFMSVRRFNLFN